MLMHKAHALYYGDILFKMVFKTGDMETERSSPELEGCLRRSPLTNISKIFIFAVRHSCIWYIRNAGSNICAQIEAKAEQGKRRKQLSRKGSSCYFIMLFIILL